MPFINSKKAETIAMEKAMEYFMTTNAYSESPESIEYFSEIQLDQVIKILSNELNRWHYHIKVSYIGYDNDLELEGVFEAIINSKCGNVVSFGELGPD
jgi:hypothetical protein